MNEVIFFHGFVAFLLGTLLASFLSTVITRFGSELSWAKGRSMCSGCRKGLPARSLVPILSYLVQCGRCVFCRQRIPVFYPALELITGVFFLALYLRFHQEITGLSEVFFYILYGSFILGSVVVFEVDRRQGLIPNLVTYSLTGLFAIAAVCGALFSQLDFVLYDLTLMNMLLGLVAGAGLFLLFVLVSRETWMGWGDVKYGVVLGLYLGPLLAAVAVFSAFVLGGLYSVYLIMRGRASLKGSTVSFGPFLVIGGTIALFAGEFILNWYLFW